MDVVTTDVPLTGWGAPLNPPDALPTANLDFSDCYVVAHGTDQVSGVALSSDKMYWIRVGSSVNTAVIKLRITLTI